MEPVAACCRIAGSDNPPRNRFMTPILHQLKSACLILLILLAPAGYADSRFSFSAESSTVTRDIIKTIEAEHYKKLAINDAFGQDLMKSYINALDPSRTVLLESDIRQFESQARQFDDQVKAGKLELAASVYGQYASRYRLLLERTLAQLDQYLGTYPDPDAVIEIDRKDSPWPKNEEESIQLWDKRVYNEVLDLRLADMKDDEIRPLLKRRYEDRLNRLEKAREDDVYETFINSLTGLYDPHTNWMSPRVEENFRISMSLSLEGIGAVLQMDEEKTKVISLVTGGPAAKSGKIMPGDHILAVGQGKSGEMEVVIGWRLDEVVEKIRGSSGSFVRLQIESGQDKSIKQVLIQREKVKLEDQAAKKAVIEIEGTNKKTYRIGVINVPSFYLNYEALREGDENFRSTTRDVANLIDELRKEKVDGIVLDLRNNGGGSLREAATFTDLFIDKGPVVQIRTADNQISRGFRAQNPPYYTGPLLVIINHLSASASEIFAGAMQDYERALVIGEQSFGKGTVQTIADLDRGQLKLTTSKFYRISGDSTQLRGVVPDIILPSLFDFKTIGESALENALPWDSIHAAPHTKWWQMKPLIDDIEAMHQARMKNNPDYHFLMSRIKYLEDRRNIKALPLDENKRRADAKNNKNELLQLTNKLRKEKSLPAYASYDELEKDETERMAKQSSPSYIDTENDFVLQEASRMLSDYIILESDSKQAALKKLQ